MYALQLVPSSFPSESLPLMRSWATERRAQTGPESTRYPLAPSHIWPNHLTAATCTDAPDPASVPHDRTNLRVIVSSATGGNARAATSDLSRRRLSTFLKCPETASLQPLTPPRTCTLRALAKVI